MKNKEEELIIEGLSFFTENELLSMYVDYVMNRSLKNILDELHIIKSIAKRECILSPFFSNKSTCDLSEKKLYIALIEKGYRIKFFDISKLAYPELMYVTTDVIKFKRSYYLMIFKPDQFGFIATIKIGKDIVKKRIKKEV